VAETWCAQYKSSRYRSV